MFSVEQKRNIADKIQKILRETNHPELPKGEISFHIHIDGADVTWSWSDIKNNGAVTNPDVNPWNEKVAKQMNNTIISSADNTESLKILNDICAKLVLDGSINYGELREIFGDRIDKVLKRKLK